MACGDISARMMAAAAPHSASSRSAAYSCDKDGGNVRSQCHCPSSVPNMLTHGCWFAIKQFSGPWWDGQVAGVRASWSAFLRQFKAKGGRLEQVVLDTELSMNLEVIRGHPKGADGVDCGRLRLGAARCAKLPDRPPGGRESPTAGVDAAPARPRSREGR